MAVHNITLVRIRRGEKKKEMDTSTLALEGDTAALLCAELLKHLTAEELVFSFSVNGKELENPEISELGLMPSCAISVTTTDRKQLILDEIKSSTIHFTSLADLLQDCPAPLRAGRMNEVAHLFTYLAPLLEWTSLLLSNIELHLKDYLEQKSRQQPFALHAAAVHAQVKQLLDLKDAGDFASMATLAEGPLAKVLADLHEFFKQHSWN